MRARIAVLLASILSSACQTQMPLELYGVNSSDDSLSVLDPGTGAVAIIGPLDPADIGGPGGPSYRFSTPIAMAVRAFDRALFVWNNSGSPPGTSYVLAIVDRCSGRAAEVARTTNPPQDQVGALAFASDGRLFGFGRHGYFAGGYYALYQIDSTTGVQSVVGRVDSSTPSTSGAGYDVFGADFNAQGTLYGITSRYTVATGNQQLLLTIDPATGAAQVVGVLSQDVGTPGSIVFDPGGRLIGSAFGGPLGNILFDIDPVTAAVSNVRTLSGSAAQGLGFARPRAECPAIPTIGWRLVTSTLNHACALATDGRAFCWGYNNGGEVGDSSTTPRDVPTPVSAPQSTGTALSFVMIGAGGTHTCGIAAGAAAYCWGSNYSGQLGTGSTTGSTSPIQVATSQVFAALALGDSHTCALTVTGEAHCWGSNADGQLGNGSTANSASPVAIALPYAGARFVLLTAGQSHSCGLTATGEAYCWGRNEFGQLGDGNSGAGVRQSAPVPVAGGHRFSSLSAGMYHTCGVTTAEDALCWGGNRSGGLGSVSVATCASEACTPTPTPVSGEIRFREVRTGANHTCGLTPSGLAYCWGMGTTGQLGTGSLPGYCPSGERCSYRPLPVFGGSSYQSLATGQGVTCAIEFSGIQSCWGGQPHVLGLGTSVTQTERPMMTANP